MRQMIFLSADDRSKDHRDCDLLMASQVVVELKVKIRILITCFLVFIQKCFLMTKAASGKKLLSGYCELRERRLNGDSSTLHSCVMT